jgi:hypothetical protein
MSLLKNAITLVTGFRKLLMGLLFMLITLILLFLGKVTGSEFISTNRDVVVAFIAANVCAKIVNITKAWLAKQKD